MSRAIPLTKGHVAIVDDEDFEWLSHWTWHLCNNYAARRDMATDKFIYMHRQILGTPAHMKTDHVNGDKLDNRRSNLRACSSTQNNRNVPAKGGKSHYKGVNWHTQNHVWRAEITVDRERLTLGCFEKEEDAARAYDRAAILHHGDFAYLNFPLERNMNDD